MKSNEGFDLGAKKATAQSASKARALHSSIDSDTMKPREAEGAFQVVTLDRVSLSVCLLKCLCALFSP
jgi:hypothetical protein